MSERIQIVPYDPCWPARFEEERGRIERVIGRWLVGIEHVGSTAVPGLDAKPVVDIAVGLRELGDTDFCIRPLGEIGYEYRGEAGVPGRRFFYKKAPRAYNLHLTAVGSEFWRRHLLFRDHLWNYPEVAREYARLKQDLARRFQDDREAYTAAKTEFVAGVVARSEKPQT